VLTGEQPRCLLLEAGQLQLLLVRLLPVRLLLVQLLLLQQQVLLLPSAL
jgi:hypothetical protein